MDDVRQQRGQRLLDELCATAGVEPLEFRHHSGRRIAQAESGTGLVRATTMLMDLLDDRLLKSVLAHEVAHTVLRRQVPEVTGREAEFQADRLAVIWTRDPEALVDALTRVAAFNAHREGVRAGGGKSDHPSLWRRVHRIRAVARELGVGKSQLRQRLALGF